MDSFAAGSLVAGTAVAAVVDIAEDSLVVDIVVAGNSAEDTVAAGSLAVDRVADIHFEVVDSPVVAGNPAVGNLEVAGCPEVVDNLLAVADSRRHFGWP